MRRARPSSPEGAWCWQSKATIRYIRENVADAETTTLLTYYALTKIASDKENSSFEVNRGLIASETMLSLSSVKRALANLENLGVIEVERPPGLRTNNRYTLMAVGSERTDVRPERPNVGSERTDVRPERPNDGSDRADVRPERPNDGSDRADVGSQLKQGSLEPLTEEKRITKKKREGTPSNVFESIYQAYPRDISKQAALKAIAKACKTNEAEYLLERAEAYSKAVSAWPDTDRGFIPYPATWFNEGRYDDNPNEWQPSGDKGKANASSNPYAGRAL